MSRAGRLDVVCVGLATRDTIVPVPAMPLPDQRTEVEHILHRGGGPAATTAAVLARLGAKVGFAGCVGDDVAGRETLEELVAEGVDVSGVVGRAGFATPESCALIDTATGSRAILTTGASERFGAPVAEEFWSVARGLLERADWVHLDHVGYCLWAARPPLAGAAKALSIDGGNPIERLELAGVKLYAPTLAELRVRYGETDVARAVGRAHAEGAEVVVVTAGAGGCYVSVGTAPAEHIPASSGPVLSTLGAGDAFHAGLLWGFLNGLEARDAARLGVEVAAEACTEWDGRSGVKRRPATY